MAIIILFIFIFVVPFVLGSRNQALNKQCYKNTYDEETNTYIDYKGFLTYVPTGEHVTWTRYKDGLDRLVVCSTNYGYGRTVYIKDPDQKRIDILLNNLKENRDKYYWKTHFVAKKRNGYKKCIKTYNFNIDTYLDCNKYKTDNYLWVYDGHNKGIMCIKDIINRNIRKSDMQLIYDGYFLLTGEKDILYDIRDDGNYGDFEYKIFSRPIESKFVYSKDIKNNVNNLKIIEMSDKFDDYYSYRDKDNAYIELLMLKTEDNSEWRYDQISYSQLKNYTFMKKMKGESEHRIYLSNDEIKEIKEHKYYYDNEHFDYCRPL